MIIHILMWMFFLAISLAQMYPKPGVVPYDFIVRLVILAIIFYLNYCLFVPNLLLNKKRYLYITVVIAFCFFFNLVEGLVQKSDILSSLPNESLLITMDKKNEHFFEPNDTPAIFRSFFPSGILFLLIFSAITTSIKLSVEWYKTEKLRVQMETQKVNSELSFLKAQLNPHFLFNSLNSIYSLAHKQSKETTNAIVILSELMRYMIYEANKEMVPLQKEIDYIKNYISLQLLRLKDSSGVKVNVQGNLNYIIEPLLLISFIENAFKYGTDFKGKTNIVIKITIENQLFNLYVFNSVSSQKPISENSGIGLENIKNRLNLLYPNSHTLSIMNDKKTYNATLSLKLKSIIE